MEKMDLFYRSVHTAHKVLMRAQRLRPLSRSLLIDAVERSLDDVLVLARLDLLLELVALRTARDVDQRRHHRHATLGHDRQQVVREPGAVFDAVDAGRDQVR